jgi:CheY-like chemotaxis protein
VLACALVEAMYSSDVRLRSRASVLVVEGDARVRNIAVAALRGVHIRAGEADTGAAAIALLREHAFDLSLINVHLPDVSGLEVISTLRRDRISVPWVLMGAPLSAHAAVAAMRLGAVNAVESPFDVARVVTAALDEITGDVLSLWPPLPAPSALVSPRSVAERWAFLILRGCAAEYDLKTIDDWARVAGISYSALTDVCRLAGIRPHAARDFLRILRALYHARGRTANLAQGLNVSDHRTLKALLSRAGLAVAPARISLRDFVDRQAFVDPACEPIKLMLAILDVAVGAR